MVKGNSSGKYKEILNGRSKGLENIPTLRRKGQAIAGMHSCVGNEKEWGETEEYESEDSMEVNSGQDTMKGKRR